MEYILYALIGLGYLKIYRVHSDAYLVGLLWPVILGVQVFTIIHKGLRNFGRPRGNVTINFWGVDK